MISTTELVASFNATRLQLNLTYDLGRTCFQARLKNRQPNPQLPIINLPNGTTS
jgi:hypothetical protein